METFYNLWARLQRVKSLSKNINPSLVLVQPRKTRPYITGRLLMGRKESNQTEGNAQVTHSRITSPVLLRIKSHG